MRLGSRTLRILVSFLGLLLSAAVFADSDAADEALGGAATDAAQSAPTGVEAVDAFIAQYEVEKSNPHWKERLRKPPKVSFEADKTYYWNLDTSVGAMKIKLMPGVAPMHVTSTIYLTRIGFYDGTSFHRIIPGFMAQGGDPTGTGRGSPGYRFGGEFDTGVRHDRGGLLSMANAGPGTDGSQFFLTFKRAPNLDRKHTIFGEVVEGKGTLSELEKLGVRGNNGVLPPDRRPTIERATISVE